MVLVPTHIEINKIDEDVISKAKIPTEEISTTVPYKDWKKIKKPCSVFKLPIEYCKFRVDNGRIATEITTHETSKGILDPNAESTQKLISDFLSESDASNNETLINSLKRDGQKEPAVITADGFLINGNRRKWALQVLNKGNPSEDYKYLKVIILPGTDDPLRPTVSDIALMENEFQVYSDGRSEYSSMNKALTLYKNVQKGIELREMLRQDPDFSNLDDREFKRSLKKYEKKFYRPVELMIEYLKVNRVKNDFVRVANKWSAFQDMSERIIEHLDDERSLATYQIQENEKGLIKSAAFNIIKLRNHEDVDQRTHKLISRVMNWVIVDKKEVIKIGNIDDSFENINDADERFNKWNDKYNDQIVNSIKKLDALTARKKDQEGPINRLNDILNKLDHDELKHTSLTYMDRTDVPNARKLANSIQTRSTLLTKLLYAIEKDDKERLAELIEMYNSHNKNEDNS